MLALLRDVPFVNHPLFRIVAGAALVALAVTGLHDNLVLIVAGALLLVMGLARGLTGRPRPGRR